MNRQAAKAVALHARDAAEARELLDMLGLLADDGRSIAPDPDRPAHLAGLEGGSNQAPTEGHLSLYGEPPRCRDYVPAGLRNLPPAPARPGLRPKLRSVPAPRPATPPRELTPCGTRAAAQRHGEPVDDASRAADNAYMQARRATAPTQPTAPQPPEPDLERKRRERLAAQEQAIARMKQQPTTTPTEASKKPGPDKPIAHGTYNGAKQRQQLEAAAAVLAAQLATPCPPPVNPVAEETARLISAGVDEATATAIAPLGARHRPPAGHSFGPVAVPSVDLPRPGPAAAVTVTVTVRPLIPTDLDAWLATAGRHPSSTVRKAAARATARLGALRDALDDLARTERATTRSRS